MRNRTMTTWSLSLLTLLALAGCEQGLGGGFKTPTNVSLIVSNTSGAAAPEAVSEAGPVAVTGFGSVKGRIVIDGAAPALAMLVAKGATMKAGDEVCSLVGIQDESVVAGEGGGLANVFIYLKKAPAGVTIPPVPTDKVIFDQKGCRFEPHAFIARTGQVINLRNSDPSGHNVHTFSLNMPKNSALGANDLVGSEMAYIRSETLPVRTVCDIHAWMSNFHLVVDHPWAAISAADGSFEIPGVPAGKMEFIVWHEKIGYVERSLKLDIVPDQPTEVSLKVPAAKLAK